MFLVYEWHESFYVSIFRNETPVSEQQPQSASSLGTEWLVVAKTSLA